MQTPAPLYNTKQLADLILSEQPLSAWQIEFLVVALDESAMFSPEVTDRDCLNQLVQMNSSHMGSVLDVAHILTGVHFRVLRAGRFGRWCFSIEKLEHEPPMLRAAFDALYSQFGWGSDAHRKALGVLA